MSEPARWARWNVRIAVGFGIILILTGVVGFVVQDPAGLMSQAVPYDLFHVIFGVLGLAIGLGRRPGPAALFNLGFGLIDLYQFLAGVLGLFPAGLFQLRPGDHVAHLVLGAALVGCGLAGLRRR